MYVKIPLRLSGLDLRNDTRRVPEDLADLFFTSHGAISLAAVYTQDADPLGAAEDAARRVAKMLPGVRAAEVFDELVTITDIAHRCAVAAEAVRLWAGGKRRQNGRPFPAPRQVIGTSGSKSMSLYAWRDVVIWVRDSVGLDPDEGVTYLVDSQMHELNEALRRAEHWTSSWTQTAPNGGESATAATGSSAGIEATLYPVAHLTWRAEAGTVRVTNLNAARDAEALSSVPAALLHR